MKTGNYRNIIYIMYIWPTVIVAKISRIMQYLFGLLNRMCALYTLLRSVFGASGGVFPRLPVMDSKIFQIKFRDVSQWRTSIPLLSPREPSRAKVMSGWTTQSRFRGTFYVILRYSQATGNDRDIRRTRPGNSLSFRFPIVAYIIQRSWLILATWHF